MQLLQNKIIWLVLNVTVWVRMVVKVGGVIGVEGDVGEDVG